MSNLIFNSSDDKDDLSESVGDDPISLLRSADSHQRRSLARTAVAAVCPKMARGVDLVDRDAADCGGGSEIARLFSAGRFMPLLLAMEIPPVLNHRMLTLLLLSLVVWDLLKLKTRTRAD